MRVDFAVSYTQDTLSIDTVHFMLPADHEVEFLALSPAPGMPACHHASYLDDNGLNL